MNMLKSVPHLSNLIQSHRSRLTRNLSAKTITSLRFASSHSNEQAHYGHEYETHEGLGNPLFLATGVGIVGLALYHAYTPSSADGETPFLTRQLDKFFTSDPDEIKKIETNNMSVVFDAADKAFFKASIERPIIRRMRNAGNFDIASPYGVVPGTETDLSDLRIKTYEDDLRKPEN